jgi:BirA family biotin operon repressor/biotin-[acetyl-CoA-carboxylase] ligase
MPSPEDSSPEEPSPDDPCREDLSQDRLRRDVLRPGSMWSALDVVAQTGSTNEDLLAAARSGAAEGAVLAAERQTRGRGRQGRSWVSQPGTALTFSVLLRPVAVPPPGRGWLPLLAGVAVARAVRAGTGVPVALKWPNDVLADGAKLAGILAEQAGDAVVVGIGINVGTAQQDLPSPPAPAPAPTALAPTSLALRGAAGTDRAALLTAVLRELEQWYRAWASPVAGQAGLAALRAEYLRWCSTIGTGVRVELPGGSVLTGVASGIDQFGRLFVETPSGPEAVSAGDVIHVR